MSAASMDVGGPSAPAGAGAGAAGEEGGRINSFMVCGTRFDVDARYTLVKPIGHGAYGVVCSVRGRPRRARARDAGARPFKTRV